MPRDLFGDVTRPSISVGNRKWYTVPASLLSHVAILAVLIIAPLMATDRLPTPWETIEPPTVIIDVVPPPPRIRRLETQHPKINPDAAPTVAPIGITPEAEIPYSPHPADRDLGTVLGTIDSGLPAEPVTTAPPKLSEPIRVGGSIRPPQKIHEVAPVYPPIAQAARVQGIVIIEASIGPDGRVSDARVLRSVPLLDQAALDAVRQWTYTPTLLNGVPVPVIMTVTVSFALTR